MVRAHLNPDLAVSTILITIFDARTRLARRGGRRGARALRGPGPADRHPALRAGLRAPSAAQTVMTYDPGSPGALVYFEAAREIAARESVREQQPSRSSAAGLGRGLGSLIPTAPGPGRARRTPGAECPASSRSDRQRRLASGTGRAWRRSRVPTSPSSHRPDRPEPRAAPVGLRRGGDGELVHSIKEIGLLQPVVVRRTGPETMSSSWGSGVGAPPRRPAATRSRRSCGRPRTPTCSGTRSWRTFTARSLNALEEAAAYAQLLEDFGCTHEEARRADRAVPPPDQQHVATAASQPCGPAPRGRAACLSAGHARSLLSVEDAEAAGPARAAGRSPRGSASAAWRRSSLSATTVARQRRGRRNKPTAPGLADLAERLSDRLETRVKVDLGRSKGKITVEFASMDDLRRIVDVMDPRNRNDRPI